MSVGQLVDESTDQVYPLGLEPVTLGRHADNDVVLADPQISRHHAEIALHGGKWTIRDLGSANGTCVNGQRIAQPRALYPGDTIRLGQVVLRLELSVPISQRDTLVECLPPLAPVADRRSNARWIAAALAALAVVAIVVVGVFLIAPRLQGKDGQTPQAADTEATSAVAGVATTGSPALPGVSQLPPRPTNTALPTIQPPTQEPTRPPFPAASPPLTVTVSAGETANLPDLAIESILFDPNPCYRGKSCKVALKVRNDGMVDAGHFLVRWATAGDKTVPVEWDVDSLKAGQEKVLKYTWIPDRARDEWPTSAAVDVYDEVGEIEEMTANALQQAITVLEP